MIDNILQFIQVYDKRIFIDVASNLVRYDKKYENIILNLLGNVVVANSIDSANKISRIINQRYKIY